MITNVSHDIKTPLTSIINYVDLLKREDIKNERAKNYIAILEDKALRLKHLTDDLVEASKISSGNVKLEMTRINFQELINQTNGEFSEKFEDKGLQFVVNLPEEPVVIEADGRRLWRIIENLYNNAAKYAMPHTRVYVDLTMVGHMARFSIKNISEQPLNIGADEPDRAFHPGRRGAQHGGQRPGPVHREEPDGAAEGKLRHLSGRRPLQGDDHFPGGSGARREGAGAVSAAVLAAENSLQSSPALFIIRITRRRERKRGRAPVQEENIWFSYWKAEHIC